MASCSNDAVDDAAEMGCGVSIELLQRVPEPLHCTAVEDILFNQACDGALGICGEETPPHC